MRRLTLGEAKARLARFVDGGQCADDSRVLERINEAIELLMDKLNIPFGKARYTFCLYDGCLTLPMELEAGFVYATCNQPKQINNMWYEFLDGGWGPDGYGDAVDRGNVVLFKDIAGCKRLRFYSDLNEDVGARILVRGLDQNGKKVKTNYGGEWIDGEYISLESPYPRISAQTYTHVTSIVKPVTKGVISLYQYNATDGVQSLSGTYGPNETLPVFRRYYLPKISGTADGSCSCGGGSSTCCDGSARNVRTTPVKVTLLASKRFIPLVNDNDDMPITSMASLISTLKALHARDNGSIQEYTFYLSDAMKQLDDQHKKTQGGANAKLNIQTRGFMGGLPTIY